MMASLSIVACPAVGTTRIPFKASKIACGYYHGLALKTNGTLYVTGGNDYGQLGTGDTKSTNS